MLTSAEVRWFFDGPVPDEIATWFSRDSLAAIASPREDHYLVFPSPLGLGLKLREGRLEIKPLLTTLGVRTFAQNAAGRVQVWQKWFGGEGALKEFERLLTSSPNLWVTVRKERTLRKFSLNGDAVTEVRAGSVFLTEGCNAELTTITVVGSEHWSVNFEAYGDPSRIEDYLGRVAVRVLTDGQRPPYPFSAEHSCSYPEWLWRTAKRS